MVCHLFYTERHSNSLTVINPSNFLGSLQYLSPDSLSIICNYCLLHTPLLICFPERLATVNYLYISINNLIKVLIFQLLYLSLQQESPLKK